MRHGIGAVFGAALRDHLTAAARAVLGVQDRDWQTEDEEHGQLVDQVRHLEEALEEATRQNEARKVALQQERDDYTGYRERKHVEIEALKKRVERLHAEVDAAHREMDVARAEMGEAKRKLTQMQKTDAGVASVALYQIVKACDAISGFGIGEQQRALALFCSTVRNLATRGQQRDEQWLAAIDRAFTPATEVDMARGEALDQLAARYGLCRIVAVAGADPESDDQLRKRVRGEMQRKAGA